jgi:hypothetical protein
MGEITLCKQLGGVERVLRWGRKVQFCWVSERRAFILIFYYMYLSLPVTSGGFKPILKSIIDFSIAPT